MEKKKGFGCFESFLLSVLLLNFCMCIDTLVLNHDVKAFIPYLSIFLPIDMISDNYAVQGIS
jgi:hypothetical protein